MWRWFVRTIVEARKRMLRKLSRSHRVCPWSVTDLNKEIKYLPNSDYCIFSGVLEYLLDLEFVLKEVKKYSKNIIFSYSIKVQDIKTRVLKGWVNHYTELELIEKISKIGSLSKIKNIFNNQIIFKLKC